MDTIANMLTPSHHARDRADFVPALKIVIGLALAAATIVGAFGAVTRIDIPEAAQALAALAGALGGLYASRLGRTAHPDD